MGNASTLFDRLTAPRSTLALAFQPVDVAKVSRRRKLAERGTEDGTRNHPPADAADLALAEQEVVTDIHAERDRCASQLASSLRAYRDALSTLQTGMDVAGMRHAADESVTRFLEIRSRWSGDVAELKATAVSLTAEHERFRQRNRLTRLPRLPSDRYLSIALMIVCVVAESMFNGLFFAGGSDLGILGGVMVALCISVFNVGIGALTGFAFLRLRNHCNWLASTLGLLGFLTLWATIVGLNGFVAHYREAYQATGDATLVTAVTAGLLTRPFGLSTLNSWLLFGLGISCSGLASWKGYGLDDPYPGYGNTERRRAEATNTYEDERRDLIEDAADIEKQYSRAARAAIETLRASGAQRQQIQAARDRMIAEFASVEHNLAQSGQQLLATYREANETTRTVAPPNHFGKRFAFESSTLDDPRLQVLLGDQGLEHDAETLIGELDSLRARVLDEHKAVLAHAPGGI